MSILVTVLKWLGYLSFIFNRELYIYNMLRNVLYFYIEHYIVLFLWQVTTF